MGKIRGSMMPQIIPKASSPIFRGNAATTPTWRAVARVAVTVLSDGARRIGPA